MEEKKEKLKFFKKISEKFKTLEPEKKKLITIISIVIVLLIVITIITSVIFSFGINNAGKIVGNIKNQGLTVKKGDTIFLSNTLQTFDNDIEKGIYKMTSDGKDAKLLTKEEYAQSLTIYKGDLYYLAVNKADNGNYIKQIVKTKTNGKNKQILVDNIEVTNIGNTEMYISDSWIYYLNAESKLEKIKINGQKRQQVANEEISYFQISGNHIYYATKDDEFKQMKKDGSKIEEIEKGIENFQILGNEVYYISKSNSHLMKLNLNTKTETEIIDKKISVFNIYQKTIYYATAERTGNNENDEKDAIYSMKINGKKNKKIVELSNKYNYICIAGNWIYYIDRVEDTYYYTIYKVKTNGQDKQMVNI